MPLFVLLVIYYCCSLIIAPHRFLQVRGNYIRCILWYIVCCCFPHQAMGLWALILIWCSTFSLVHSPSSGSIPNFLIGTLPLQRKHSQPRVPLLVPPFILTGHAYLEPLPGKLSIQGPALV